MCNNKFFLLGFAGFLFLAPNTSLAAIYQWTTDAGGKIIQSNILVSSKSALPYTVFASTNLTKAYLIGANLESIFTQYCTLTNAKLNNADLRNAVLSSANLTNADMTGSIVNQADFSYSNLSANQLYTTASYKNHDLSKIILSHQTMNSWDFSGQNLTRTDFTYADLTKANFTNASFLNSRLDNAKLVNAKFVNANLSSASLFTSDISGADLTGATVNGAFLYNTILTSAQLYSTASYKAHDLSSMMLYNNDLTNWNFTDQNLSNARLIGNVTGANFAGATVQGADLTGSGLSSAQLYSTSSYKSTNLQGVTLTQIDMSGWNFSGQNLRNAFFPATTLTGADFTGATINNANFVGANLTAEQLYSTASYKSRDLSGVSIAGSGYGSTKNMAGWNLAGQNLTNASLGTADLTDVDLTDANITGTHFGWSNLTANQLYSTANYKKHDLTDVFFGGITGVSGWSLVNQKLSNCDFRSIDMRQVDLTDAIVDGVEWGDNTTASQFYSTASYKTKNLQHICIDGDMSGWNLSGQDFTYSQINASDLTNADFTNAIIKGVGFYEAQLTPSQLYSTASYKNHDLGSIVLWRNIDLSGADFSRQNLAGASLDGATFTNANFTNANLMNTQLRCSTSMNLSCADVRGSYWDYYYYAIRNNTIYPNGMILGLNLNQDNPLLIVRNYELGSWYADPQTPIPIHVLQTMQIESGSVLEIELNDQPWISTISFDKDIPITIAGDLHLVIDTADPQLLVGKSFQLFDWTGVSPNGQFNVVSDEAWDTSQLYTTGIVTLLAVPEPATLALLGSFTALSFLAFLYRRKNGCFSRLPVATIKQSRQGRHRR